MRPRRPAAAVDGVAAGGSGARAVLGARRRARARRRSSRVARATRVRGARALAALVRVPRTRPRSQPVPTSHALI